MAAYPVLSLKLSRKGILSGIFFSWALARFRTALALSPPLSAYLAKTKETFKFAEQQHLEFTIQTESRSFNSTRLLVDVSTGSSLFRLDCPDYEGLDVGSMPSCLRRCDWIAEILVQGDTAQELLERLRAKSPFVSEGWTLDYVRMDAAGNATIKKRDKPTYTMKTLTSSIAQAIPSIPALDPLHVTERLLILDSGDGLSLVRTVFTSDGLKSMVENKWAKRPFQYSSAISVNVAETVMNILLDLVQQQRQQRQIGLEKPIYLLDPTCGSGTFLACGMANGMQVEGCDCKPKCTKGTLQNLQYLFGEGIVTENANIYHHDSSTNWQETSKVVDCVVANLPWGINSVEYSGETVHIIQSIRQRLIKGTPCVFITKESGLELFEDSGFEILGRAHVPQRNFQLPKGKKNIKNAVDGERNGRNSCIVTIVLSD
jgi:tRNA G10  N-methylase Trm11